MKDATRPTDAHQKAFAVNLDPRRYGTFAEIGAGQEVVRWFFRAGGAAGTIAKSISAYDMTVSDAIYGKGERYVSRTRLERMLEYEHALNIERLRERRGNTTAFFAFADTVKAASYNASSECHGWLGMRFQSHPRDADSQIVIHVNMLDKEKEAQQEALGIVGVNLVYGACFLYHEPEMLMESLLDGLTTDRIEIDMIEMSGIEFRHVDNRVMSLKLVQLGLAGAAMFAADGTVLQPSEVLYKKPVLVERGSFRPVTHVNVDMLECALKRFAKEPGVEGENVVPLMEITMRNLLSTDGSGTVDVHDFLARADVLAACGMSVLISDYFEYYRLAAYLGRHTKQKIGVVMGAGSLKDLFEEQYYTDLDGGILESFGRLFKNDLKVFVYPLLDRTTNALTTVQNLEVAPKLRQLYEYLVERGCIEQLDDFHKEYLSIFSREILMKIKVGDASWETMVPLGVAEVIKRQTFFDYQG
ncbi:MAG: TonB-dependent receptor [Proteobacteria bacterium]|nr:TonB-dependent receptor [Pseudomonadota bacterium]